MSARDHLASLPAIFINVEQHESRRNEFMAANHDLFKQVFWQKALPIKDVQAEANDFAQRVAYSRQTADPLGYFNKFPYVYTIPRFTSASKRAHEYAATRSLTISTLMAIKSARAAGWERFMIMDDDARPRPEIIDEMNPPADNVDFAVWGGAYGGGGLRKDNDRFLAGEQPQWISIKRNPTRFFSHAYELTQAGAAAMEKAIREHFYAVDFLWWYAQAEVTTRVLQPSAFTQVGESVRVVKHNPRTREGSTVRAKKEDVVA